MSDTSLPRLGFFERLSLAFRVLGDAELAARVRDAGPAQTPAAPPALAAPAPRVVEKERIVERNNPEAGALMLLSILQRDGRLIDFIHEDVGAFADADVGAAARIVHDGCKKALSQYFTFEPVKKEPEGAPVVVDKGFDPNAIRLAGNVAGEPPYRGKLAHAGWKATDVRLPERAAAAETRVVAPAEVEI